MFSFIVGDQVRAAEREGAAIAPKLHILSGTAIKQEITNVVRQGQSPIDDELIQRLARNAPVHSLPFELKLVEAVAAGDTEDTRFYANQVLSLQPRSLAARLQIFKLAAAKGEYSTVFEQYEDLVRLRSLNDSLLTDALIGIFRQHGDWTPLLEYMTLRPPNGNTLARKLLLEAIAIEELSPIVVYFPDVKEQYLKRLMRDGLKDEAYSEWKRYAGIENSDSITLPFNGTFIVRDELPPFNWFSRYNRAELQSTGGLYVSYLGTGRPEIIRQVMAAPAGKYILQTKAKGRMPTKGGALEWIVTCHGDPTPIARSTIVLDNPMKTEMFESPVSVPNETCKYQSLQLFGVPGEFPKTSRTQILSVAMIPAS